MKKLISVLLAVMMMTVMLVPCASADGEYDGKTVILYTGNLRGDVDVYAKIAHVKTQMESKGAEVILADAGNYLQGRAAANSDRGLGIYELMDAAGYDVAAMGAYEFSYGDATTGFMYHSNFFRYFTQSELLNGAEALHYNQNPAGTVSADRAAKAAARFAVISSNIAIGEGATGYYDFDANKVIECGELKLGFIAITDTAVPSMLQDGFMNGYTYVEAAVPQCDVTVCLNNGTAECKDADIVINAPTNGKAVCGAYVIDNASREISRLEISLDASDGAVAAAAEAVKARAEKAIGVSNVTLTGADSIGWKQETNLGDFAADALLWYANNKFEGFKNDAPVVAIINGGNCDQFIYSGDVTKTDLLRALPFSPMGVGIIYVSGAQLLEVLEAGTSPSASYAEGVCPGFAQVAGLEYTVDAYKPYDAGEEYGKFYKADSVQRVTITSVNGKDFDENATYALIADNYLINGNDTYYVLKEAKAAEGAKYINNGNGIKTRDIAAMYIEEALKSEIGVSYAQPQGRITVNTEKPDPFTDIKDSGYHDWIVEAAELGIINGYDDGAFRPNNSVTRAQFITMLYRAVKGEAVSAALDFTDSASIAAPYLDAVKWGVENKVINGYDDKSFRPNQEISRAQMATFMYRYLKNVEGYDFGKVEPADFSDAGDVAAAYLDAVNAIVSAGVMNGTTKTTFAPNGTANRGMAATVMLRMHGLLNT